jgi:hypothetical protein
VLYEQFSAAFAPGPLINNRALAEAAAGTRVECWVEVLFEHNSKEYQARRSCYVDKPTDEAAELEESESKLDLKINGKLIKEQEDIEEAIGNVLPGSLHRYLDGGGFPIVMDSPFGSLDSVNRSNIAEAITQLADQLVVLVSKTQWLNEVEQEMQSSIGSEYILVYYTAKDDAKPDEMERYGRSYPLVKPSPNEFTWTEVVQVDR